jgi:hypothetical protein
VRTPIRSGSMLVLTLLYGLIVSCVAQASFASGSALSVEQDPPSPSTAPSTAPSPIEFWTLEPNEGQSAGGHSALRLGEWIYHVEHRDDGLLQDRRDPRRPFESAYRGRDNRSIDVLQLDLTTLEARSLVRFLDARLLDRRLRLDALEEWDEDLRWLDRQYDASAANIGIPGLALFEPSDSLCERFAPHGLAPFAPDAIAAPLAEARKERALALESAMGRGAEARPSLRRLTESTGLVRALEALKGCIAIQPSRLVRLEESHAIDEAELETWRLIEKQLSSDIRRLIASQRPDRGLALMLSWARWQAVQATLRERYVYVVDGFAEANGSDRVATDALNETWRASRMATLSERTKRARTSLRGWNQGRGPLEARLDRLERAAHDLTHERTRSRHGRPHATGALSSTRALERPVANAIVPWPEDVDFDLLQKRRAFVIRKRDELRESLSADLDYALLTRNCVTELLVALDQALDQPSDPKTGNHRPFASARRSALLSALAFIPAVAHQIVASATAVREQSRLPSIRESAILEAEQRSPFPFGIRLREANTLTSRFYRPHKEDSAFIFFANDSVLFRPAAGLANLTVALGTGGVGILTSPVDRGRLFQRGVKGLVMSLPELFFVSIRRGSYPVSPLIEP